MWELISILLEEQNVRGKSLFQNTMNIMNFSVGTLKVLPIAVLNQLMVKKYNCSIKIIKKIYTSSQETFEDVP